MLLFQEVHEDEKDKIYVLVSNSDLRLRLCLTKEAWNLIKRIPEISTAWINNEKMREQNYKEAVKANDLEALVAIIKMIYQTEKTCTGEKVYCNGCKVFPDSRKFVIYGTGSCYWKTPKKKCVKRLLSTLQTTANKNFV